MMASCFMFLLIIAHYGAINVATLNLGSNGNILCPGQPQMFMCRVHKQGSLSRLQWRIDFISSISVTRITQRFTTDDPEGTILRDSRPGVRFEFNLTSNSNNSSTLTSVMTVTMDDINGTALINNATMDCGGDEAYPIMLHVRKGPPSSPLSLTQDLMKIKWNLVDVADHYTVSISPPLESESVFFTSNTTIHLSFLYNQDYNVSVVANNCAGSSTAANINVRIGCCTFPSVDSMVYVHNNIIENSGSSCAVEGSYTYSCQPELVHNTGKMTYCMRDSHWDPNPNDLECPTAETNTTNSPTLDTKLDILIPSLTMSLLVFAILTFLVGLLLGILLIKCIPKLSKKNDNVMETAVEPAVPLYEEIKPLPVLVDRNFMKIKDNEAYCHIKI